MARVPLTAAMIRTAGKPQASASSEIANLQVALAEATVKAFTAFTAAPVRAEPDGLSISAREMPMEDGQTIKLESPRGALTPVLLADRPLVMALCEAAFGGSGTEPVFDGADRPYSATERHLHDALLNEIARLLPEALELCLSTPFHTAAEEERKPAARETFSVSCITCRLLIYVFGYSGELTVLLPEAQISALVTGVPVISNVSDSGSAGRNHFAAALRTAEVEFSVLLPAERKPLAEVANLRPGQLLKFEASATTPLLLMAGNKALHEVRMVQSGERLGVEIIS